MWNATNCYEEPLKSIDRPNVDMISPLISSIVICETPRTLAVGFNLIQILFTFAVGAAIWQQTQMQVTKWEGSFATNTSSPFFVQHQPHHQLLWKVSMTLYRLYQGSFTISPCKPELPYISVMYCSGCNKLFFHISFHSTHLLHKM